MQHYLGYIAKFIPDDALSIAHCHPVCKNYISKMSFTMHKLMVASIYRFTLLIKRYPGLRVTYLGLYIDSVKPVDKLYYNYITTEVMLCRRSYIYERKSTAGWCSIASHISRGCGDVYLLITSKQATIFIEDSIDNLYICAELYGNIPLLQIEPGANINGYIYTNTHIVTNGLGLNNKIRRTLTTQATEIFDMLSAYKN